MPVKQAAAIGLLPDDYDADGFSDYIHQVDLKQILQRNVILRGLRILIEQVLPVAAHAVEAKTTVSSSFMWVVQGCR